VNLSTNFTLEEFERTGRGTPNKCTSQEHLLNMIFLCRMVLEPLREVIGPIRITSGYRSLETNQALLAAGYSASKTSQHMVGQAADMQLGREDIGIASLFYLLAFAQKRKLLPLDQVIIYRRPLGRGWIHCSSKRVGANRGELLVQESASGRDTYTPWQSGMPLIET
jgi:hypothetical protein